MTDEQKGAESRDRRLFKSASQVEGQARRETDDTDPSEAEELVEESGEAEVEGQPIKWGGPTAEDPQAKR